MGLANPTDATAAPCSSSGSGSGDGGGGGGPGSQHVQLASDHAQGVVAAPTQTEKQQQQQPPSQQQQQQGPAALFSAIYAVGDNPAADIRGANQAGPPWVSVLVRTGVFTGPGNSERDPAHVVVSDVLAAVQAGLHRARNSKWHSMR